MYTSQARKKEKKRKKKKGRSKVEKKKQKEELAKKKAKEKAKKAPQAQKQFKQYGKRPAASRSSKRLKISSSASNDPSDSLNSMTSGVGTSESFITMDNTVMHATEHYSASSTAMTLPADPSNQDYEC